MHNSKSIVIDAYKIIEQIQQEIYIYILLCFSKKKEYVANGFAFWLQINKKKFESSIFLNNKQCIMRMYLLHNK